MTYNPTEIAHCGGCPVPFLLWIFVMTHGLAVTMPLDYPPAHRSEVVETLHGVKVADPYRWLEDLDAPATRRWVEAEARLARRFLDALPERPTIRRRLSELWNYERFGIPRRAGPYLFYSHNDGLQNQAVILVQIGAEAPPRVLIDPNRFSSDGTLALAGIEPSPDGRWLAWGLSEAGSDWVTWKVREVATGRDRPDELKWVKFSTIAWSPDGSGFYYARYDPPQAGEALKAVNRNQKLYYHRLGDPQAKDRLVLARPDHPDWSFAANVTDDGAYLIVEVEQGTDPRNLVYYQPLDRTDRPLRPLIDQWRASYRFLGNHGSRLWFLTDDEAPRYRVIAIDLERPEREHWVEVVPEQADTLEAARYFDTGLVLTYMHHAHHRVVLQPHRGAARVLPLPGLGSVVGFTGRSGDTDTFFGWTSFNTPTQVFHLDLTSGEIRLFRAPALKFNPDDYVTRQVFYRSKDGTRVPMFISHRKDLDRQRPHPTLLYGYGGFNISLTPWFSVKHLAWMEMGGILAVPNLRGGGEYGRAWHEAGTRTRKQNVFDDFIAAARWLIEQGYTTPGQLGSHGASNGGLLVAAVMLQEPRLFGAVVPAVGVLDMLRFHRFTIGWAWTSDYGSPEDPEEFKALLAYSPVHNVRSGTAYPPTLIMTADHDDRVYPAHSFKFAAALQAAQAGKAPILLRVERRAGHGAGKPVSKRIDEAADLLAFLYHFLFPETTSP